MAKCQQNNSIISGIKYKAVKSLKYGEKRTCEKLEESRPVKGFSQDSCFFSSNNVLKRVYKTTIE